MKRRKQAHKGQTGPSFVVTFPPSFHIGAPPRKTKAKKPHKKPTFPQVFGGGSSSSRPRTGWVTDSGRYAAGKEIDRPFDDTSASSASQERNLAEIDLGAVLRHKLGDCCDWCSPSVQYLDEQGQDFTDLDFVACGITKHCTIQDLIAGIDKYTQLRPNDDNDGALGLSLRGKNLVVEISRSRKPVAELAERMDKWMSCLDFEQLAYRDTVFLILFNNHDPQCSVIPNCGATGHVKAASIWMNRLGGVSRWRGWLEGQLGASFD
eukprot:TRINITY_DN68041_c2_g1_i1.p1 TRINITY_DN68041_c2_g1~~TRINITY_DN68041_c2_g1_i1.p1  ORF type:complete len:264 (+),score=24.70 TRINITY_DN68041_c2_g1_i1:60-851(+)